MEVIYLPHQQIDKLLWDDRLKGFEHPIPYAFSWYLDIICRQQWDALVTEEYDFLMPLPWNKKLFGIPQLYQPMLGQQLGIIGNKPSAEIISAFLNHIPNKFKLWIINLNEYNTIPNPIKHRFDLHLRRNLILDLSPNYESLHQAYSKSLKKRLKKAKAALTIKESQDPKFVTQFYQSVLEEKVKFGQHNYDMATQLFTLALEKQVGKIYMVQNFDDELLGCGFFLHGKNRIINLFGATNEKGKSIYAMHFLLDYVIQDASESNKIFDFEGSEIEGIANFFKSFGSKEVFYPQIRLNKLPFFINWTKQLLKYRKFKR